ncbi:MAG: glycosyltransferase family 39 protein [Gemmatimonadaceae bacterium]|nr:glycosyltransferase family 39 protein [Gemmatimonadaceae bacterium]
MAFLVAALLALGLALGLSTPAMDYDAAQYAAIAMEMLQRGEWLEVYERGVPYLDKPPLVFWTAAASYAVFGVSDWAYKLPSLLALAVAIWGTGRLAAVVSGDDETARLARWTLASSIAAMLMVSDPRTDTLLMAGVAVATWQWAEWVRRPVLRHLVLGALAAGIAMLAKGPIGLVAPGVAVGVDVLVHRRWRVLWTPSVLLVPVVILLVLSPMLLGLWREFGSRGLEFFFWTQSFGRVTGASEWKNDTSPLYFTHTFLWTFLPWAPVVLWRLGRMLRAPRNAMWRDEALAVGGFLLLVAAISSSRYKLPHYIYVALPFAAVLAARQLRDVGAAIARGWRVGLPALGLLVVLVAVGLRAAAFGGVPWWGWAMLAGVALLLIQVHRVAEPAWRHVFLTAGLMAAGMLAVNSLAAPKIFSYQVETAAGARIREAGVPEGRFVALNVHLPSLDFAARRIVPNVPTAPELAPWLTADGGPLWVFARSADEAAVVALAGRAEPVARFDKFGVSRMNGRFLNPATRPRTTEPWVLLKLWPRT